MMNFLALIGWNPGTEQEVFSKQELIQSFDISKIQKAGGAFNEEKLDWMNKEHMKLLPKETVTEEILARLRNCDSIKESAKLNDKDFVGKISAIIFDHISKWGDVETQAGAGEFDFYFNAPVYDSALLSWKGSSLENSKKHLTWVSEKLSSLDKSEFADAEQIKAHIFDYATEQGRGDVLWPLRVSLSGKEKSPDPFTLLSVFGKNESVNRINNALLKL
jgi:glutamyl-tRNA synthetase